MIFCSFIISIRDGFCFLIIGGMKNSFSRMRFFYGGVRGMVAKRGIMKQSFSLLLSGLVVVFVICVGLLAVGTAMLMLGQGLSFIAAGIFKESPMELFYYILIMLVITCSAALAIPIIILARNIQRSAETFSLLQFDEEAEDEEFDEERDLQDDDEELNEFLRRLHKSRNIGPFIPSPKTMDDLCPCGSGLKYKDCCGKSWL